MVILHPNECCGISQPWQGTSRGMLFRAALIFVVGVWDADLKEPWKFLCLQTFFTPWFLRRLLICVGMLKWPLTSWKVQNFNKSLLLWVCAEVCKLGCYTTILLQQHTPWGTWYRVCQSSTHCSPNFKKAVYYK